MKTLYFCAVFAVFLTAEMTAQGSWELKGQNLAVPSPVKKAIENNGTYFAVGGGRISRSTDGGASFTANDYSQLVMSIDKYDAQNNVLAVGYQNSGRPQVWRSYNDGITWQRKDGTTQNGERFNDIVMLDSNIAVVSADGGIYKTTDFSQTYWVQKFALNPLKKMTKLIRLSNGNLLAGAETSNIGWAICLSTDAGESWASVDGNSSGNYIFRGFVQTNNGNIYAHIYDIGSSQSFFRKSTDNGATWSGLTTGNFAGGTKIGFGFASYGNNLYCVESSRGISVSTNEGTTWHWSYKKTNYVGSTPSGLLMFPGETSTDGTFYTSVDPSVTANVSSIPLNTPISLSGIGTITFTTCTAVSLSAYKFSIKSPLTPATDDVVNQHWEVLMEPPTSSYNGSITFNYDPSGINIQAALQAMRFVPPKSSNGYNGAWEYLTTSKDTVNHTFTVSGITEFPIWITLRKNGPLPGNITVKPVDLNFGQVLVNSNLSKTDTITNIGSSAVNFTSTTITGVDSSQFSIVSGGGAFSLAPSQSRIITINFAPTSTGVKVAKLTIVHDGLGATQVNLTGEGIQGILSAPSAVDFGSVRISLYKDSLIDLSNTGNGPLTISSYTITGANFSLVGFSPPVTIQSGATLQITARFTPLLPIGPKVAMLTFQHNGAGGSTDVALSGVATQSLIGFNFTNVNFGPVDTLKTKDTILVVSNTGNAVLNVTNYIITGQFSVIEGAPPFSVPVGSNQNIKIRFAPQAPNGPRTGALTLVHDAPGSPSVISLNGQAVPVELKSFTADIATDKIILHWKTSTETNNYGFEVQHFVIPSPPEADKLREGSWQKLAFVKGHGTTTKEQAYELRLLKTFGLHKFRLKQIDFNGEVSYSQILEVSVLPTKFVVNQNYPNPFNPSTTIAIEIPIAGEVEIKIFNIVGQLVDSFREKREAGVWNKVWTPEHLASGQYFLFGKFNNTNTISRIKMILLK